MALEVRAAERGDLGPIVAIYNHYVERSPVTFDLVRVRTGERTEWLAQHVQRGPHRILVAVEGRTVVGWASTSPFRSRPGYATTVESSVYCRPRSCGRGVGSRLYDELFRSIQDEDVERIVAGIALPNPASIALHRRFGFRPVGTFTRAGRKFGRYWDVAWFERPLAIPPVGPEEEGRGRDPRPNRPRPPGGATGRVRGEGFEPTNPYGTRP